MSSDFKPRQKSVSVISKEIYKIPLPVFGEDDKGDLELQLDEKCKAYVTVGTPLTIHVSDPMHIQRLSTCGFFGEQSTPSIESMESSLLYLSGEEAFFLCFALNILDIDGMDGPKALWNILCHHILSFPWLYIAYHHYRAKGWVPKSGFKYGADFVLYRRGPVFYHSEYTVRILPECQKNGDSQNFTWKHLVTMNRVASQVAKNMLLCYIVTDVSLEALQNDFNKIRLCSIQDVELGRWRPQKTRQKT